MTSETLAQRIDALLPFLDLFRSGKLPEPPRITEKDGVFTIDDLTEDYGFKRALIDHGWVQPFHWPAWQHQAEAYVCEPERLDTAGVDEIVKLLTTHARKERFCSGHISSMAACGHLTRVLERLAEIRATL